MTDAGASSLFVSDRAARIANYDRGWSALCDSVVASVARGMPLTELLARYDAMIGAYTGFIPDAVLRQIPRVDLGHFGGHPAPNRLAVRNGRYLAVTQPQNTNEFFDVIASVVDPEVDCIVEFGSGLGFNLARLRLRLPHQPITYIACEPTEHGRRAAELAFSADPRAKLQTHAFDYAEPDLDFLGRFRKIIAFTVHSVEQMPVLGETFYRKLLATSVAHCFHLEPVGWQRYTELARSVLDMHRDAETWQAFCQRMEFVIEDSQLIKNAAQWSVFCGYNTDLLSIIAGVVDRGEAALTAVSYEILGLNPLNPSTLIAWRRTRQR